MKTWRFILIGLAVSLAVGGLLCLAASPDPDGLERVSMDKGFGHAARGEPVFKSPFPDYLFAEIADERLATGLAGFPGTLVVFAIGTAIAMIARKTTGTREKKTDGTHLSR